jgi:hypothetical protein
MDAVASGTSKSGRNSWEIQWKLLAWPFACSTLILFAALGWLSRWNLNLQSQLAVATLAVRHR